MSSGVAGMRTKMVRRWHWAQKKPLDFGGNPNHVTLGLGLGYGHTKCRGRLAFFYNAIISITFRRSVFSVLISSEWQNDNKTGKKWQRHRAGFWVLIFAPAATSWENVHCLRAVCTGHATIANAGCLLYENTSRWQQSQSANGINSDTDQWAV